MGDDLLKTGESTRSVFDKEATARRQAQADTKANQSFQDNWLKIFGPSSPYNNNFRSSLSGYFNGQPMEQIAANIAPQVAFHPKVKKVFNNETGGGVFLDVLGNMVF